MGTSISTCLIAGIHEQIRGVVFHRGKRVRGRLANCRSDAFRFSPICMPKASTDYISMRCCSSRLYPILELDHKQPGGFQRRQQLSALRFADPAAGSGDRHRSILRRPPRSCSTPMSATAPVSGFSADKFAAATRYNDAAIWLVGSALASRAVDRLPAETRGEILNCYFDLPGVRDPNPWRGSSEVHGARAASRCFRR